MTSWRCGRQLSTDRCQIRAVTASRLHLASCPAPTQERVLAVWDFDWTMVEDNSDTWVVEQLGAKPDFLRLQQVPSRSPQLRGLCDEHRREAELQPDDSTTASSALQHVSVRLAVCRRFCFLTLL